MSDDDEIKMLMVAPEDALHTDDSILIDASCGCRAWISASGLAFMKNTPNAEAVCSKCFDLDVLKESLAEHGILAPKGSKDAVLRHFNGKPDCAVSRMLNVAKEIE